MNHSRVLAVAALAAASLITALPAQAFEDYSIRADGRHGGFYRNGVYSGGPLHSDAPYIHGRDPSVTIAFGGHRYHHRHHYYHQYHHYHHYRSDR